MHNQEQINQLKNIVQDLLDEAKQQGATAAEAGLSQETGLSVNARMGDVETIEHHCDQGLGITVFFGQRKGSASTSDLSPASIKETVRAACSIARYTSEDEYAGLPDKAMLATEFPDLDVNHPWTVSVDEAIALAIACEDAALTYHSEISNSEGASVNTHQGIRVMGNSLGFLQGYSSTRHSLSCSVLGQRGDSMQRDYWYSVARNANDLEAAVDIGRKAAERTIKRLEARRLTTRQCPVLYAPETAAGLLGSLMGAISGGNLYRKSTFLLDALGQQIFPEFIRIHEQPYLTRALGSSAYDGDGVATQTRDIVSNGVLRGYVLGTYSARKLGMQSTGNAGGVHNLTLDSGALDFDAMLKLMGTGLLVTELMGQGVKMMTGDYSRGASGFWVENGEIQYPVEEITIAGNLKDMFKHIVAVGNDVDYRGNTRTGSILIERMSIAGE
ncbi:metalloprotease PmbA [Crenothrix polyspora]|uniref:Peptidase required for the maturation and secretion of the antibiotic peptide MccB17 n=1 Tax=Crenothrix polyspora TaxID=360316 RepID=A0A1R4HAQ3_9GAMM|nr:metalloprotease PmbA [Crenothrix polyspora]SJM93303.1 peptidase required for the maturation and secretion of the antibiotic peptide MccB17 [Crenothrix polyspora]